MRITNQMQIAAITRNLRDVRSTLARTQSQMADGRTLRRPSDDPAKVRTVMSLRSSLQHLDQYESNINDGRGWLVNTEHALTHLIETLQEAREVAVYGASSPTSQYELSQHIKALLDDAVAVANQQHNGEYLFSGFRTDVRPFQGSVYPVFDLTYNGSTDTAIMQREIAPGLQVPVNVDGARLLPADANFFRTLYDLHTDLQAATDETQREAAVQRIAQERLPELDRALTNLTSLRSEVGVWSRRLDQAQQMHVVSRVTLEQQLTDFEATEVERTFLELQTAQQSYQAILYIGARVLPTSLLDFLR